MIFFFLTQYVPTDNKIIHRSYLNMTSLPKPPIFFPGHFSVSTQEHHRIVKKVDKKEYQLGLCFRLLANTSLQILFC